MKVINPHNSIEFLSGGGEMGRLIQENDWSLTSLGPSEFWPQSLRTSLNIILNCKFPMFLWWGPDLVCFYNDAFRPSLGQNGKHPMILGMKAEVALVETWNVLKPRIDYIIEGGESTWNEDQVVPIYRNGKVEDVYWTFSYSPVHDELGKVAGVLVTCTETNDKVYTLQHLRESEGTFRMMVDNIPNLAWMANADGWIYWYNKKWYEYTGTAPEQMEGWGWQSVHDAEQLPGVLERWKRSIATGEEFEMVFPIKGSDGRFRPFLTRVLPVKDNEGNIQQWFGSNTDITGQKEAENALKESEERFRTMAEDSEILIAVGDETSNAIYINNAWVQLTGRPEEELLKSGWIDLVHPEDKDHYIKLYFDALEKRAYFTGSFRILNKHGQYRWIFTKGPPRFHADGTFAGYISSSIDVTELYEAREKIKVSEQRFEAAIKAVKGILWTNNAVGEMEGEQAGWASITGQHYDEYQGYGWANAVHPEDAQPTIDAWNQAVLERKTFEFEHRLKTIDGSWRDFSIRAIPLINDDGTICEWVGVHTDITETKQAAKALKENKEKLNIVIDASELGTWEIDVNTRQIICSPRFREIMGFNKTIKLSLDDTAHRFHPAFQEARLSEFRKALITGVLHFAGKVIWDDKSEHWIESKGKVFYDEQHNPVTIIGTIADLTEEKRQQQILFESEQKFRLLADSMPQHIWTSDPEGNLNYFNQSVYDYSGLTVEQLNKDSWIQIVHPDDQEGNMNAWIHSITTGSDFLFEHRFRKHNGEYRWQLSRAIPQKDENGKIQMWVGTSTDIQDQKMFTSELEKLVHGRTKELENNNIELAKMNKELQSFAYISSHDLQEPLRKIQMFSSRLLEKEIRNLTENGQDQLNRMHNAANRMQTLIDDLLVYSRTNSSERKFQRTHLQQIVEEVKSDLKEELEHKQATIEVYNLCEINMIHFQFRQLLLNLVSNSLKFSTPGVPPVIKIHSLIALGKDLGNVHLDPHTKYCHICFSDNGIGFDQEFGSKIFELFQRLHGRDEYSGTGIGLAIVKKIVENHNGFITATSEPGKGSSFDFYLPVSVKNTVH